MVKIIAIRVVDRIKESGNTQKVLNKYSSLIRTRLGFHELNDDVCSREGYILLHLDDDEKQTGLFLNDLDAIYGIELKQIALGPEAGNPVKIAPASSIAVAGMLISNRDEVVLEVQRALTLYGCTIRTRLGVNLEEKGEEMGLILLELTGDNSQMNGLVDRLSKIENVSVGVIAFE